MDKLKYSHLKSKSLRLRRKGFSYNEIKKKIGVPKSTLSFWLKDVPLTEDQRKRFYTKPVLILSRGPQSQKERRKREVEKIIEEAEKEISFPLSIETFRLVGAFSYWAEGAKTHGFQFSNSDPFFIIFMIQWLEKVLMVSPKNLKVFLNIYQQQNELELKQFWSQLSGIPLENFGKSFVKPLNKGYKKNNLYYGTIKIKVPKGTDMRYRVFGWVKAILQDITPQVELTQKKWKNLKEVSRPINLPEKMQIPMPR